MSLSEFMPNISVNFCRHSVRQRQWVGEVAWATLGLIFCRFPAMAWVGSSGQQQLTSQLRPISSQLLRATMWFLISTSSKMSEQYSSRKWRLMKAMPASPRLKMGDLPVLQRNPCRAVNSNSRGPQDTIGPIESTARDCHTAKPLVSSAQSTMMSSSMEKKTSAWLSLGILQRQFMELLGVWQKQTGRTHLGLSARTPICEGVCQLFQTTLISVISGHYIVAQRPMQVRNWELSPARAWVTVRRAKEAGGAEWAGWVRARRRARRGRRGRGVGGMFVNLDLGKTDFYSWQHIQKMSNPQYMNYPYLIYPPNQQMNTNYPSLTQTEEGPPPPEASDREELANIVSYIKNLKDPQKREEALNLLSRKRETYPELPILLWHSVGTITILLQEIIEIYSQLSPPPNLKLTSSNRICLVVGLLQCLALHPQTRQEFLKAHIPLFLYPFLNTSTKSKIFQNLRVTSLGVIGALVKESDPYAITFLMQTEIVPLCLRIMKNGQALSKTVATFIIQKILCDEKGLSYICATVERFFAVSTVLNSMLKELIDNNKEDHRLSKHIMKCYSRLSENVQACQVLNKNLPAYLKDPPKNMLDEEGKKSYNNLMKNLNDTANR